MTYKTVTEAIDNDYKEYAMYTIENRAIPCYLDGLKNVGRKILYVMLNDFKNKKSKVAEIGGSLSSKNYHHGESSAMGAVITLAADYNNNVPLLTQHGAFGTRLIPEAAAPRYIFASLNEKFYDYFQDFDALEYDKDPDNGPEPLTYLPNIPWVLVNGIKGIAVGFACNYLPHNPKDIAKLCLKYTNKENIDNDILVPEFPEFFGKIITEEHNKFKTQGIINRISRNTWEISEVPIGYTREKYFEILTKLMNDGKIQDFDDNCSKSFNFVIKVDSKQDKEITKDPIKYFKLEQSYTENYTAIDENSNLIIFDKKTDIIKKFVDYRINKIQEQLNFDVNKINEQVSFNKLKMMFIIDVLNDKIDLKKTTKKDLIEYFKTVYNETNLENISKIISIPVHSLTADAVKELDKKIKEQEKELTKLKKLKVDDVMKDRLLKIING